MSRGWLILVVLAAGCASHRANPDRGLRAYHAERAHRDRVVAVARDGCADWRLISYHLHHADVVGVRACVRDLVRLQGEWVLLREPGSLAAAIAGAC